MALYTRIGIATSRKRIWPFQIDRIGVPPERRHPGRRFAGILPAPYPLATASGSVPLDTNAGIAPAFIRAIGSARPPNQGKGGNYRTVGPSSQNIYFGDW